MLSKKNKILNYYHLHHDIEVEVAIYLPLE